MGRYVKEKKGQTKADSCYIYREECLSANIHKYSKSELRKQRRSTIYYQFRENCRGNKWRYSTEKLTKQRKRIWQAQTNQHILLFVDYNQSRKSNIFQRGQMANEVIDYLGTKAMEIIETIVIHHPHIIES